MYINVAKHIKSKMYKACYPIEKSFCYPDQKSSVSLSVKPSILLYNELFMLKEGQKEWSAVSLQQRIEILKAYSKLLASHIEPLAKTLTDEVGKPLQQSKNEINARVPKRDKTIATAPAIRTAIILFSPLVPEVLWLQLPHRCSLSSRRQFLGSFHDLCQR
jgi:hypothetical protein